MYLPEFYGRLDKLLRTMGDQGCEPAWLATVAADALAGFLVDYTSRATFPDAVEKVVSRLRKNILLRMPLARQ
jgi:hypothetical protein